MYSHTQSLKECGDRRGKLGPSDCNETALAVLQIELGKVALGDYKANNLTNSVINGCPGHGVLSVVVQKSNFPEG